MTNQPLVSVVMSVYNGGQYLHQAIESILNQTFKNFEFIIINDGSTDKSLEIIKGFAKKDRRIKAITRENKGLVASLNEGILIAKGQLIARQDADDASLPTRLEKQVNEFNKSPNLVLLGSSMKVMDEESKTLHTHYVLLGNTELKQELLVRSPFAHGSTMYKKEVAIKAGLYSQQCWPAEDYEFWLRLGSYGDFANINQPLYIYRENSSGISVQNQHAQNQLKRQVQDIAWQERKQLIKNEKITLQNYSNKADGIFRIRRIFSNLARIKIVSLKKLRLLYFIKLLLINIKLSNSYNSLIKTSKFI